MGEELIMKKKNKKKQLVFIIFVFMFLSGQILLSQSESRLEETAKILKPVIKGKNAGNKIEILQKCHRTKLWRKLSGEKA
jgi:hypothetical protein